MSDATATVSQLRQAVSAFVEERVEIRFFDTPACGATEVMALQLTVPKPGDYDIEFHIKNARLDEHMPLSNFKVE